MARLGGEDPPHSSRGWYPADKVTSLLHLSNVTVILEYPASFAANHVDTTASNSPLKSHLGAINVPTFY